MFSDQAAVAIAGAGSIGCYVGGCLALAGRRVALLARPPLAAAVSGRGMTIVDLGGAARRLAPGSIAATSDPAAALADAAVVLVTVKSGATAEMAGIVERFAPERATVISLQNGISNAALLRARLGERRSVLAAMVPYNVVQETGIESAPLFRRTTGGTSLIEVGRPDIAALLDVAGAPVAETAMIERVLWGKLLLNLNNALNGLSGLPLARQLADRRWRLILADQIAEALRVMRRAGVRPARIAGPPPALIPAVLRLPDALFARLARRMIAIDPEARSSTWEDLARGRPTEVDAFQGEILRLAGANGLDAPLSRHVVALLRKAEAAGTGSPQLSPAEVALR